MQENPKLQLSAQEEADALVLRPEWCQLPEACIPVRRTETDPPACFGASLGTVLAEGSRETIYARQCFKREDGDSNCIGLTELSCAEWITGLSMAHETQLRHFKDTFEEEDEPAT